MSTRKLKRRSENSFLEMLKKGWSKNYFVCVGLDSQYDRLPEVVRKGIGIEKAIFKFNKEIVDATHDLVCAYKLQYAFYGAKGKFGIVALIKTVAYIHKRYPDIPVILDAKRNDIGNTAEQYAVEVFDTYRVDAVTVNPYLGFDGVEPFLKRKNKGVIVLCRTSNPGAREFQDLIVSHLTLGKVPFYQVVAYQVTKKWNANGNCGLVVGATYPKELAEVREISPDLPILIPGIGKQGGDVEKTVKAGQDSRGEGMIIHSARGIIFASSGPDKNKEKRSQTERLHKEITTYL
jgi:orotidine-5'-phosphate decarboxylase